MEEKFEPILNNYDNFKHFITEVFNNDRFLSELYLDDENWRVKNKDKIKKFIIVYDSVKMIKSKEYYDRMKYDMFKDSYYE